MQAKETFRLSQFRFSIFTLFETFYFLSRITNDDDDVDDDNDDCCETA